MKKYFYLFCAIILLCLGLYAGYVIFSPKSPTNKIDSQSIVTMLQRQGFLVTQTYIVNQEVNINNSTGSVFKDFFWGQKLTAFGTIKVNTGVDLNSLKSEDISVSPSTITVSLPPVSVSSAELIGNITLQNDQGILKRIFDNDNGYNTAYQSLRTQALNDATTSTIRLEAEQNTRIQVARFINLAVSDREVQINFKQ
jgi:hypothetical protein